MPELSLKFFIICKPKEWSRDKVKNINGLVNTVERLGGFLNNDIKYTRSLIIPNW